MIIVIIISIFIPKRFLKFLKYLKFLFIYKENRNKQTLIILDDNILKILVSIKPIEVAEITDNNSGADVVIPVI